MRATVGMVFQHPDAQIVATVVEEDVAFGPENLGVPPAELRRRVDWALDVVGMTPYRRRPPHWLSGGQKQRVALAGAIAMKPDVLVLDEATALLDPIGRRDIWQAVIRLNREDNMTVITITHFMEEAALADRVIVMWAGQVVLDGPPRHVFGQADRLRAWGLDVPPVTQLAHRLHALGLVIPPDIVTLDDFVEAICALRAAQRMT
ncbi:MAG: ATP-binding cassette domain-containing protein [Ardenticatenia bacterium]|nr:ATP-binding cassette domain-containing protein [Ardenticatenia bacterium]